MRQTCRRDEAPFSRGGRVVGKTRKEEEGEGKRKRKRSIGLNDDDSSLTFLFIPDLFYFLSRSLSLLLFAAS